jgi:hypothetical protein
MILPVALKEDSDDIVEIGTVITSLARMYDSLCSCYQFKMLNSSSYWLTISLSRYAESSEAAAREAPEVAACSKALADDLLCKEEEPPR